jgi:type VI secretion system protein VasJ
MALLNPEIVKLGTEPISPSSPAGESIQYDAQFEQISNEIAKTKSLTGAVVDWDAVVQLSTTLLRSKSKDLRLASYLTAGLLHKNGWEGLLNGLEMTSGLLRGFWQTAYPELTRLRGRVGALQWLDDRFAFTFKNGSMRAPSDELALELETIAGSFETTVQELLEDQSPAFSEMLDAVRAQAEAVRARARAAEAAQLERERQDAAVESGDVSRSEEADKVFEECATKLLKVAAFLRSQDLSSPLPYRISRSIVWGWRLEPPAQNDGVTYLPAPTADVPQRLESSVAQKDWMPMLAEVEASFADFPFWFDLQRYAVIALGGLGEKFAPARDAVVWELARFVTRMPEILKLRFSDGTPFAGPPARMWLDSDVLPVLATGRDGASGGESRVPAGSGEIAEAVREARAQAAGGNLAQAVGIFKAGIDRTTHGRGRFLWRLELAKLCMEIGRPQLALPLLTALDAEVARFSLEEWEPELSLSVVQSLFQCRQKLAGDMPDRSPDVEQQLGQLFDRLCRLDVNVALTIQT